ncbi:putative l-lactate dehydrogenase [Phaeomoniella chlamydospora]|uniref:Putative l-lactate dehydrogenase n=1 Tax=Phaeomoniella chlamydospora TaxID=158046 RepID=A0A0G2ES21_PHACM|nr:putative l-lactate dehydrogenase [Phaeomoniella chlamydospora]
MNRRIGIVGVGDTGSAIAFSLLLRSSCDEIVLNDSNGHLAKSQAADLEDAQFLSHTRVRTGGLPEIGQCDIAIVTAGVRPTPIQSRLELAESNIIIFKDILEQMAPLRKDLKLVIVTNPVDILTYVALQESHLPPEQVIGTGTLLDTIRLKNALQADLHMPATSLNAFVYGEHGHSQVIDWSNASTTTGVSLGLTPQHQDRLAKQTKEKAYRIISGKPGTSFGVAASTTAICESILRDRHDVQPISLWSPELGCTISLPAMLDRKGAHSLGIEHLQEAELVHLKESAETIKKAMGKEGLYTGQ